MNLLGPIRPSKTSLRVDQDPKGGSTAFRSSIDLTCRNCPWKTTTRSETIRASHETTDRAAVGCGTLRLGFPAQEHSAKDPIKKKKSACPSHPRRIQLCTQTARQFRIQIAEPARGGPPILRVV